jgi:tetratricopeptide (TPR) repeat protein/tRNA A-37 threonylcarbamoyl transferase component Bud32
MSSPTPPPPSNTDRNLLFAVLALHAELIDNDQFAEACAAWTARRETPLADLLVERGWLSADDRREVERLLERKLKKHGGDVRASLGAVADAGVRDLLRAVGDEDVRKSLSSLPPAAGHVLVETVDVPPRESASRYSLVRLHAQGGLGRVYIAHDKDLNRDVALKEIKPEQAKHPEAWRRFLKEAQITGQLEHPNIVPVYEVSRRQEDDQPFYTMRLVRGQTLRDGLADYHRRRAAGQADPLELPRLLNAFVSVCQAIGFAHSRGVVHRDLKPDNVMLGDFGQVIVLDWGLAKMADEADDVYAPHVALTAEAQTDKTVPGSYIGSPAYMAPEQAAGRADSVDARTDVYGLGAILFEILTGRPPHQGQAGDEVLKSILEKDTPRTRAVLSSVPPALDAICAKAMAKERKTRYAKATELADDVQRFLAAEPASAWPEPWTAKARRWVGRHRVAVTSAALILVIAVPVLTVATILVNHEKIRAEQSAESANTERLRAEANFALAREAVEKYLTQVGQSRLLNQPGLQPLRRDLLSTAASFFQRFVESEQASTPEMQAEVGRAYGRWALLTGQIESRERAIELNRRAAGFFEKLVAEYPDNTQFRRDLTVTYNNLGNLLRSVHRLDEAEAVHAKALDLRRQLVADHPEDPLFCHDLAVTLHNFGGYFAAAHKYDEADKCLQESVQLFTQLRDQDPADPAPRHDLAEAYNSLGDLRRSWGSRSDAMGFFQKALDLREKLSDEHPDDLAYQRDLAASWNNIAVMHRSAGEFQEAAKYFDKSLRLREKLARDNPTVKQFSTDLAGAYRNHAESIRAGGHAAESLDWYRRAVDVLERVLKSEPEDREARLVLRNAYRGRAMALDAMKRSSEAVPDIERALRLDDGTRRATLQLELSLVLARSGAHARAVTEADAAAKESGLKSADHYDLACCYSLAAAAAERDEKLSTTLRAELVGKNAAKALEQLTRARDDGLFKTRGNVERVKKDADLEALRQRKDFKKLVQELETSK